MDIKETIVIINCIPYIYSGGNMKEWLNKIWYYLKQLYEFCKDVLKLTLWIAIALIPFVLLMILKPEYSAFGETIVKMAIPICGYYLADKYLLPQIDTIFELKEKNIAVGLVILAFAIIFAAAVISS